MENKEAWIALLPEAPKPPKTKAQKVVRKTFKGTAQLTQLLPSGSVLTFQILCPVLTHQGQCPTFSSRYLTFSLLFLCSLACFLLSFTDSFRDEFGKVRYGLATARGLWVLDGTVVLAAAEAEKYRLRFLDFVHAVMTVLVFTAVAMFDQNVVKCFFPMPSEEVKELLRGLPVLIGVVCSALFLVFPTRRHGIGFPLSKQ